VAGVFFVVGLVLMDVIPMPFASRGKPVMRRRGLVAALVLGLVFGVALGPCTFAFMAPILGLTLKVGSRDAIYAAALLAAYGVGHCSVIVAAGVSTGWVQRYLNWNERSRGAVIVKRICGLLVLVAGVYLLYLAGVG
jgi:cytochrome c-type biogenesis protein